MENLEFNKLLLRTAFSCMACDGNIDNREVKMIKSLHHEKTAFGDIDIDSDLESLRQEINQDSTTFLKGYFQELSNAELTETNELKLIEIAIDTINADKKVEYSEIKFFKVIRSMLKVKDEAVLDKYPHFEEYLEQDIISGDYLSKLQKDYFDAQRITSTFNFNDLSGEITDSN